MINRNIKQYGTQTTGLGVMISRCSFDSQHGVLYQHPTNVGCSSSRYTNNSFFRYTNDEQIDHSHQRPRHRKWTGEDNKLALYSYFRSNLAKRGCRKRMIEIWTEFGRFKVINQRLADQFRTLKRMVGFMTLKY